MNLKENIRLAFESLRANKMRALLTMLGIIIGIGSVIGILTVGDAMSGTVTSSMSVLGASNITVSIQQRSDNFGFSSMSTVKTPEEKDLITDEMIETMQERFESQIIGVSLSESAGAGKSQVSSSRSYANVSVMGANVDYQTINDLTLLQGRFLSDRDLDGSRNAAVVSDKFVNNLFGGDLSYALGKEFQLYLNNEIHTFTIVGVYEYINSIMNMSFASEEEIRTNLYIPITTSKRLHSGMDGYQTITVMAAPSVDNQSFSSQLRDFFDKYYENNVDFRCMTMSMESITEQMDTMMDSLSIAISVIAGISLLVGGIGVMNIMLVSVTERTREIGTRKALGATNSNIRVQFIVESTIVCLLGGVIGVLFGGALGYFGSYLLDMPSTPSFSSIALAVGFSMAIGIFFGYYPANKAAKLDPIEALRYE